MTDATIPAVTDEPAGWRVQWVSRRDLGEPDRPMGRLDFAEEEQARAYFESGEARSKVGAYWRMELQQRGPWQVVERGDYAEEEL